jgi:putative hydrolase of the HAD superfamily
MYLMKLESPQAIRTIFFDAGYTLLRASPSVIEVCQDVCQQHGLRLGVDQLATQLPAAEAHFMEAIKANRRTWASEQDIRLIWTGYYQALLHPFVVEEQRALLNRCVQEIIDEFGQHTRWELFPDALPTIQALQDRRFTLGIISDWGISLAPIISGLDLTRYFDCLIISAVTRHAKPEPDLYDLALQRVGGIADYAIHIGDSYIYDVLGARAAGMTPILIDRPGRVRAEDIDCILIRDLRELLNLLEIPAISTPTARQHEQRS